LPKLFNREIWARCAILIVGVSTWDYSKIRVQERDEVRRYLEEKGIGCGVHYPIPIHLQEACRGLGYTEGAFPIAENLAEEFLSLPMFPELTEEQTEYVARCVSEVTGAEALV
jgi:dTDP-4-amino-4,6-dideoxygalactose transaminase